MAEPERFFSGWRGLGRFWTLIAALLTLGGLALWLAGPPQGPVPRVPTAETPRTPEPPTARFVRPAPREVVDAPPALRPGRDTPGPIADPDPALLEASPGAGSALPRIAVDGRMPMQVYAAGFDSTTRRVRVGFVLAGVGLNQADSEAAIGALPGGITLAVAPDGADLAKLLTAARAAEHEYLLPLSMDASSDQKWNLAQLDSVLSRMTGYVGVIGAEGDRRGASQIEDMAPVLAELAHRGLLYIDQRPGAAELPLVWSRRVDLVVDGPGAAAADIDEKLAQLTHLARVKGSALGFAGAVRPVTTERLAAWAGSLADDLVLAPVSAVVRPPAAP